MKYIDLVTDAIFADIKMLETLFDNYVYGTWIFMCMFYIGWIMLKYIIITLPFRLLFTNTLQYFWLVLKNTFKKA